VHTAGVDDPNARRPKRIVVLAPGLVMVGAGVALSFGLRRFVEISPLVIGVVLGTIAANVGILRPAMRPGVTFAARQLLRFGIVLLGLRLSFDEVRSLGWAGLGGVVCVVLFTFFGVQWLGRRLGLSSGLSLLVATGYSICGASAVAAMEPLSGADEEETAYAIALVTLCGSLSIFVFPLVGHALGLTDVEFGTWVGAGVHDVGQVTATASVYSDVSLASATLVKLTRVILLAPMIFGVGVVRRSQRSDSEQSVESAHLGNTGVVDVSPAPRRTWSEIIERTKRAPIVPLFVVGFIAAIGVRATGWLSDDQLATAKDIEQLFLTAGMFGLGAGVQFSRLRRLGGRPLVLGLVSWMLVAVASLVAAYAVT
jgi:uncharacterized integral membrane protein (TIGR00698 family)